MKIVSISKDDWDNDAEDSIGLDVEHERSLSIGECFKRKLLTILLKEGKSSLVLQDKNIHCRTSDHLELSPRRFRKSREVVIHEVF